MKSHTFRGRKVSVILDEVVEGYAQFGDAKGPDELYISVDLGGRKHLDRAVHESLHFCFPAATEEQVKRAAADIARFLWRLGYRRAE